MLGEVRLQSRIWSLVQRTCAEGPVGLAKFSCRGLDEVLVGTKLGSMPNDPGEKWVNCTVILLTPVFGVWWVMEEICVH